MTLNHSSDSNQSEEPLIAGFAASLGETLPIDDEAQSGIPATARAILRATGLQNYRAASDLQVHVEAAIQATLAQTGIAPGAIDCVIISSADDRLTEDIRSILSRLGMPQASVFGVSRAACAGGLMAIGMADSLVRRRMASSCLVLCYDQVATGSPRLMPPTIGVLSDGAASCLVSNRLARGFSLGAICFASDLEITDDMPERDFVATFRAIGRKVKALGEEFYARSGTTAADWPLALMNNLSFSTMRLFSSQLGLKWADIFTDQVASTSHVFSGDLIINLEMLEREAPQRLDQPVMLFANSPSHWIISGIQRVAR